MNAPLLHEFHCASVICNETISLAVFQSWFVKTGFLLALGQNTIPYHDYYVLDQSKLEKVSKAVVWRKKSGPDMVVVYY